MPDAPKFVGSLSVLQKDDRLQVLQHCHRVHMANRESWVVQLDAFEGSGGFLDGGYLWPHPREDEDAFKDRRAMARYHNYVETLIDLYVRFMFTQQVARNCADAEYEQWQLDVDGAGTGLNDYLKRMATAALVNGHVGALMDKPPDPAGGPSRADETGKPFLALYRAPSILDWRHTMNRLSGVKLAESSPEPGIGEKQLEAEDAMRYLLWDDEGWARYSSTGELLGAGVSGLGMVPLVTLRPKESQLGVMQGRALISNANIVRALFNRASEEDEVLRGSAFSVLTCEVSDTGDVAEARRDLHTVVGVAKAIVARGRLKYETPDVSVPGIIRANIEFLVHEMYRAAHVRMQRESLAAESGDSIRLQYTELNEMLQGFAKSLAACEKQVARTYFAWMNPTPEAAQAAYERAKVEVKYPDEFFLDALITDLESWAAALDMNLGVTMAKRIKKKAARRVDADIPPDELRAIDAEIEAQPKEELMPATMPPPPPPQADTGEQGEERPEAA